MKNLVEPIKSKREISLIEKELSKRSIRNQLIWVLGINSGLRVSDILALNIEDVFNFSIVAFLKIKYTFI